jgi:hypothetical protein
MTVLITASANHAVSRVEVGAGLPGEIRVTARRTTEDRERYFDVDLDPNLAPGSYTIAFEAFDGRKPHPLSVQLEVEAPIVNCPKGWARAGPGEDQRLVAVNGLDGKKIYPKAIERVVRDAAGTEHRVVALLIQQATPRQPVPFYIMRDKVWLGLYRAYAEAERREVPTSKWYGNRDRDDLPVLGVKGTEAAQFAEWLGGLLPTGDQWDQAWGKNDGLPNIFPPGKFDPKDPAGPAVGGQPRAVHRSTLDVSYRGCRDMSGNGLEWTRLPSDQEPDELVLLRGRSYRDQRPLTFEDTDPNLIQRAPFDNSWDEIGFRVVIELA